jgi:hypothetical protein
LWQRYAKHPARLSILEAWAAWLDAGVGVALGAQIGEHIIVVADIDPFDEFIVEKIKDSLPASPMAKIGRKGLSLFFLADPADPRVKSGQVRHADGNVLVDVLAVGRQTILPSTIHPSTGTPYVWIGGLVRPEELPISDAGDWSALRRP